MAVLKEVYFIDENTFLVELLRFHNQTVSGLIASVSGFFLRNE